MTFVSPELCVPNRTSKSNILNICMLNCTCCVQMELLCRILQLSDLQEQSLPRLCSSILASTSDLSYSTATTMVKSLLLKKVLPSEISLHMLLFVFCQWHNNVVFCLIQVQSLSAPASRCLVTAVTSLSSRYPRPVCSALIGPVLDNKNIGMGYLWALRVINCVIFRNF